MKNENYNVVETGIFLNDLRIELNKTFEELHSYQVRVYMYMPNEEASVISEQIDKLKSKIVEFEDSVSMTIVKNGYLLDNFIMEGE